MTRLRGECRCITDYDMNVPMQLLPLCSFHARSNMLVKWSISPKKRNMFIVRCC